MTANATQPEEGTGVERRQTAGQSAPEGPFIQIAGDNAGGVNINAPPPSAQSLNQLPRDLPQFVGRAAPRAELSALLSAPSAGTPSIVTISGMAGVGKTAFAAHIGRLFGGHFPDAALHVNLHGYEPGRRVEPSAALSRFLRDLGIPGEHISTDAERRAAQYRSALANKRVLILLDNAGSAQQVRPLLPGSSASLILVTSRDSLRGLVAQEGAYPVELALFSTDEAVQLLGRGCGPKRLRADPEAAEHIAELCGHLPLALGVVAGLLATRPSWPLPYMADLLGRERDHPALPSGLSAHPDHDDVAFSEVRASFALSYQCLDPALARLFRRFALVPGIDFTLEAAAVLAETGLDETRRSLQRLVDAHLVSESATPGRYRCHDLLRRYASVRVDTDESKRARLGARRRLLRWYTEAAYVADNLIKPGRRRLGARARHGKELLPFTDRATALDWFEHELPNLVAATRLASDVGFDRHAWQIPEALGSFLNIRKHWANWHEVCELGLDAARRRRDRPAEGSMLNLLGLIHKDLRSYDQAVRYLEQSQSVWRETRDTYGMAQVLLNLGSVRAMQGDVRQAGDYLREGLRLARRHGYRYLEARFRNSLGRVHVALGETDIALEHLEGSVEVCRDIGDLHGECDSLNELGMLHSTLGHFDLAVSYSEESLAISRRLDAPLDRANAFATLGHVFDELQRFSEAIDAYRSSLEIRRVIGDRHGEGYTLRYLGDVFAHLGEREQARSLWRLSRDVVEETSSTPE